jgi:CHAD domain-containing protein
MHRAPDAASSSSPVGDLPGSIAARESRLPAFARDFVPRSPAATAIVTAFTASIERALDAIVVVDRDPVAAVHELRRGVRSARAILRVVEPRLTRTNALEIHASLRTAIRETGTMRDRDVLPAALALIPAKPGTSEARAEVEAMLLSGRASARKHGARARRLAVLGARLSLLVDRFADLLPENFSREELIAGLRRLARRARRSVRCALQATDDLAAAHGARKRVRELAVALQRLGAGSLRMRRRATKFARLSTKIGATLDLELLRSFVRTHSEGLDEDSAARLLEQLKQNGAQRRPRLLRRARRWLAAPRWTDAVFDPSKRI